MEEESEGRRECRGGGVKAGKRVRGGETEGRLEHVQDDCGLTSDKMGDIDKYAAHMLALVATRKQPLVSSSVAARLLRGM